MYRQTVKVQKYNSLTISIPKVMREMLGIKAGDALELTLDYENKQIVARKKA